jgi:hypothetical protein
MYWSYFTSDTRWWVKEAVFREAADFYANPPSDDDEDGEDDENEEGEDQD